MRINQEGAYELPVDLSESLTVKHTVLPNWVSFNYPLYTFKPTARNHVGLFSIKGILSNKYNSLNYEFKVKVVNDPPFLTSVPKDEYVLADAVAKVTLSDPED